MKKSLLLMLFLALTWAWTAKAVTQTFDFEDGNIPAGWTNDATYPWEITTAAAYAGTNSIRSGNAGINSSTSSISATFTFAGDGTISFAARCSSEQSDPSYDWDYGTFFIDGVQQGSKIINSASFTVYNYNVEAGTHTFMWKYKKDSSVGSNDDCLYVDDVVVDLGVAPACPKPTGLEVSNILHNAATLSWTSSATNFDICINDDEDNLISVSESPYSLTGLTPLTNYSVKVRTVCGGSNGNSEWTNAINFKTKAVAESVGDSWSDDFEGTSCGWELINGTQTNMWAWGTAASNGGTHSLYVSNDNGSTYAYGAGASFVYATKLLSFTNGKFLFSYDWQANGESSYDYLRAWLAPSSATFTAGQLPDGTSSPYSYVSKTPSGWISLDGGGKLNLVTAWQTKEVAANVAAGNYYLVLMWCNDGSGGSQPPAAVDNVSIIKMACPYDVEDLEITDGSITTSGASLTWTAGEATQWQVAYSLDNSFPVASTTLGIVSEPSMDLSALSAASVYYVKVRAYCGETDFGVWSDVISFTTECAALDISTGWSENFDSYTASGLPICWSRINGGTSYNSYPYIYGYSSYSHSPSNCLYFYTYGSSSSTGIDDQYAVLPEMDGLNGKQITLWAKGYSASSSFKIGLMSDPADVSTFTEIVNSANPAISTSYQEYTFIIPSTTDNYVAIMMPKPKSSSSSSYGVYIDDISILDAPTCDKPTALNAVANGLNATFSWTSDAGNFSVAHATDATANPDDNIVAASVSDESYEMNSLALGDHYFWVRANCGGSNGSSIWAGPVSVHIGYCVPSVSSVDGDGISNVTFGMGDNVVNNNTSKATYIDCLDKIGAVQAGVEATIAITYATGYTYGTLIWVDLDKDLIFEDNEILYTGTSQSANPTTLNATITIPSDQALGNYVMRIGGADSGFDSYISGSSTTAPSACYSGNWACFQDYTIRVLEAPSCLPVSGLTLASVETNSASFSWTPGASEAHWQYACVAKDADPVWDNENIVNTASASVSGLNANSSYDFYVRAYCDSENQSEAIKLNFHTECAVIIVDAEHPFFEGFEDVAFTPNCWSDIESNSHSWSRKTSYSHSGSASAYSGWYGDIYLIMPDIQIENVSEEVLLTFWSYNEYVGSYEKNSVVLLDGSNETELWSPTSVNNSWVETSINLSAYKGQTISLAFKYEGDNAHGWYIDDVSIRSNISIAINASRYATYFNADDAYIMPEGLVGHIFNASDKLIQKYEEDDVVPAGVPLVLEGNQGNYQLIPTMANGVVPTETNDLKGNNDEGTIGTAEDGFVYYVLSLAAVAPGDEPNYNSVGFYYMREDGKGGFTMPAHKAYLKYGASSAPARFYLFNGENNATWLENLQGVEGTVKFMHEGNIYILRDSIIYDATGRKVRELK